MDNPILYMAIILLGFGFLWVIKEKDFTINGVAFKKNREITIVQIVKCISVFFVIFFKDVVYDIVQMKFFIIVFLLSIYLDVYYRNAYISKYKFESEELRVSMIKEARKLYYYIAVYIFIFVMLIFI